MPTTIGLLLALSFTASLCALGFLIWAIAKRQFTLSQSDALTIFEPGEKGVPDDTTAFGHHSAGSAAHRFDAIRAGIDEVGRKPVLLMVVASTFWLVLGSIFGVIASLKLHLPDWLVEYAPLTFGRVRTMHLNLVAYGWLSVAGIAVALWITPRIFHTPLRHARLAYFGAIVWTVGVALGVTAIASGWTQGLEWLEIPWQIGLLFAIGGACLAIALLTTAKHRKSHHIYVSGWYFLGGLVWFPILYVISNIPGLHVGAQQATVYWWFARNVWACKQSVALRFVAVGARMYTLASFQGSIEALRSVNSVTHFTHYTVGHAHLGAYAFVTMVLFGAFYYMLPYVTGRDWPWPRLLNLHFWLVVGGFSIYFFGLSIGGIVQGMGLLEVGKSFADITRATIPYLEARSIGGSLMTLGHFVFAFHIAALLTGKGVPRQAALPASRSAVNPVTAGA